MPTPLYSGPSATELRGLDADPTSAPQAQHPRRGWVAFFGGPAIVLALGAAVLYIGVRLR